MRRERRIIIIPPDYEGRLARLREELLQSTRKIPGVIRGQVDISGTNEYWDYDDRNPDMSPKRKSRNT